MKRGNEKTKGGGIKGQEGLVKSNRIARGEKNTIFGRF